MERYGIKNRFQDVSFEQYRENALRLQERIQEVRPSISSRLLLTTNGEDYDGAGSLTIITPEFETAQNRRERYNIEDLTSELWDSSFKRELIIDDDSVSEPYMINVSNEVRDPKRMIFHGQFLDEKSQDIFENFKEYRWTKNNLSKILQTIDSGFPVTSPRMLARVYSMYK